MNDRKSEAYDGPDRRRLTQKGVFSRAVNGLIARHVIDERKTERELRAEIIEECAKVCDTWERFTAEERNGRSGLAGMLAGEIRSLQEKAK